jgi:hypothetical protein
MRELRRDQTKLFRALEEFANIQKGLKAWAQFRKRWPDFFPESEYDHVMRGQKPSVYDYPHWLDQIWKGGETDPYLLLLLGVQSAPGPADEGILEDSWIDGLSSMPAHFYAVWDEGLFSYRGSCDFRALYLLFLDSWKARTAKCGASSSLSVRLKFAQPTAARPCSANSGVDGGPSTEQHGGKNERSQIEKRWKEWH